MRKLKESSSSQFQKDINFSNRELDVIACITNGRTAKKAISELLGISDRTASTHTYNITKKLNCSSCGGILSHVEKYGLRNTLRLRYNHLLISYQYKKALNTITKVQRNLPSISCRILYQGSEIKKNLVEITSSLHEAGLSVSLLERPSSNFPEYIIVEKESGQRKTILVNKGKLFQEVALEVAAFIISSDESHEVLKKFKTLSLQIQSETPPPSADIQSHDNLKTLTLRSKYLPISIVFIILMGLIALYPILNTSNIIRADLTIPSHSAILERPGIIAQLESLVKQFKNKDQILPILFVGCRGSGKTTLAHIWLKKNSNKSIIWEISAESSTSIANSFIELSRLLAIELKDHDHINLLKNTSSDVEKAGISKLYIQKVLCKNPHWVLLFDDVSELSDIEPYFPQDKTLWGNGMVILTTQNKAIAKSQLIPKECVIEFPPLQETERLHLFMQTLGVYKSSNISPNSLREIEILLKHLPPFPLDIVTAAKYILENKISPSEYLSLAETMSSTFIQSICSLQQATGKYVKIRYNMTMLSAKRIIELNEKYLPLITFISLIENENIPTELLSSLFGKLDTDYFLETLQKNYLITLDHRKNNKTASMHKNTQDIIRHLVLLEYPPKEETISAIISALETYTKKIIAGYDRASINKVYRDIERFLSFSHFLPPLQIYRLKLLKGDLCVVLEKNKEGLATLESSPPNEESSSSEHCLNACRRFFNMGVLYRREGNLKKAKEYLEKSLLLIPQSQDHYGLKIKILTFLGRVCVSLNLIEDGINALESALALSSQINIPTPDIHSIHLYLGFLYRDKGDFTSAVRSMEKALDLLRNNLKDIPAAWVMANLGNVYCQLGQYEKSLDNLKKSEKIYKKKEAVESGSYAWILNGIAALMYETGNTKEAKILMQDIKTLYKNPKIYNPLNMAYYTLCLARIYEGEGLIDEALTQITKSLELRLRHYGERNIRTIESKVFHARVLTEIGEYKKAKIAIEGSSDLIKEKTGETHPLLAEAYFVMAKINSYLGKFESARTHINKSLKIYQQHYGKYHLKVIEPLIFSAHIELLAGNAALSKKILSDSLKILTQDNQYKGHPVSFRIYELLSDISLRSAIASKIHNNNSDWRKSLSEAKRYAHNAYTVATNNFGKKSIHVLRLKNKVTGLYSNHDD